MTSAHQHQRPIRQQEIPGCITAILPQDGYHTVHFDFKFLKVLHLLQFRTD